MKGKKKEILKRKIKWKNQMNNWNADLVSYLLTPMHINNTRLMAQKHGKISLPVRSLTESGTH